MRKYTLNAEEFAFRIYTLDEFQKWQPYELIRFKDITSSSITTNYIGANTLELSFKDREKANEYQLLAKDNAILIERLTYFTTDNDEEESSEYNLFFFFNGYTLSENYENDNVFTFNFLDWKGYIEGKKIVNHNVYYDTLPTNETDDFNKIKYPNTDLSGGDVRSFEEIIIDIYQRNIGDMTNSPLKKNKGKSLVDIDDDRKVKSFNGLKINNRNFPEYRTLQEKKTILDFKSLYYDYAESVQGKDVYNVELKLIGEYIRIIYNVPRPLTIDNIFSKDIMSFYNLENQKENYINDVLVESQAQDVISVEEKRIQPHDLTTFETLETSANEDGDTTSMSNNGISKLEELKERIITTVEIEFKEYTFFKDIKPGSNIELLNFNDVINGTYQIEEITEIIEDDYITYDFKINEREV